MNHERQTAGLDFYTYPPVGADDWRYVYQSAQVRVLEIQMLTKTAFQDMANADSLRSALDLLSSTEYSGPGVPGSMPAMLHWPSAALPLFSAGPGPYGWPAAVRCWYRSGSWQ